MHATVQHGRQRIKIREASIQLVKNSARNVALYMRDGCMPTYESHNQDCSHADGPVPCRTEVLALSKNIP